MRRSAGFFGQSYGERESTTPLMGLAVVSDHRRGSEPLQGAASTALTGACDPAPGARTETVVLLQPTAGWKKKVVETETLCFHDATSWPASARNAGKPPKACAATAP